MTSDTGLTAMRVDLLCDCSDFGNPKIVNIDMDRGQSSSCILQKFPFAQNDTSMRTEIHFAVLHHLGGDTFRFIGIFLIEVA